LFRKKLTRGFTLLRCCHDTPGGVAPKAQT
jgi:hypothetical protein